MSRPIWAWMRRRSAGPASGSDAAQPGSARESGAGGVRPEGSGEPRRGAPVGPEVFGEPRRGAPEGRGARGCPGGSGTSASGPRQASRSGSGRAEGSGRDGDRVGVRDTDLPAPALALALDVDQPFLAGPHEPLELLLELGVLARPAGPRHLRLPVGGGLLDGKVDLAVFLDTDDLDRHRIVDAKVLLH